MRTLLAILFLATTSLAFGQDDIAHDSLPPTLIASSEREPILIRRAPSHNANQWGQQVPTLFSDDKIEAKIAEMLARRGHWLAEEDARLLQESQSRQQMEKDPYIATSSPIFIKRSMYPATTIVEYTTGGEASTNSTGTGGNAANVRVRVGLESGTSEAFITVKVIRRTSMTSNSVVTGFHRYSSTNLDRLDFSKDRFFWGSGFSYEQQSNPCLRRGLITMKQATLNVDKKLDKVFANQTQEGLGG